MTALAVSRFTGRALQLAFSTNRTYESGGLSYDIAGKVRAVSSVPSPANRSNGLTFDVNGQLFITDKASAVAPLSRSNGLTFDFRGALVVTLETSAALPIHQSNGLAFDASGALVVTDSGGDVPEYINHLLVNGFPILVDGFPIIVNA